MSQMDKIFSIVQSKRVTVWAFVCMVRVVAAFWLICKDVDPKKTQPVAFPLSFIVKATKK